MQRTPASTTTATRSSARTRDACARVPVHGEERRRIVAAIRTALRGRGRTRRDAERALLQHPRHIPAHWIPLVLAERDAMRREGRPPRGLAGRVDRLLLAIADESARRRVERRSVAPPGIRRVHGLTAGARTGRLLRALFYLAPDPVLTVRASGRVGLWSRAGVAISGRRRRDLLRDGARSLFTDASALDEMLKELEDASALVTREERLRRADGAEVPVRVFGARLGPDTGDRRDPDRHLFFFHDLTEVQRIRSRLIETEKLSAMAKIAGSVAHEFRNPLNSLFLSTDLLEDELSGSGAPEEAIAPTLAAIREEIERLNQIINHYLSLSKVAMNTPEVVDLGSVVQEFAGEWAERAAEKGIDLRVRVHPGDLSVTADPNQVRRVLVNLVENAFDALDLAPERGGERPGGGAITLAVRPMRRTAKLTVKDNGPGIPEDLKARVFEPFFTSKSRGSGLGLYLVREIVLAHGGGISLASTGGRGTTVAHALAPAGG